MLRLFIPEFWWLTEVADRSNPQLGWLPFPLQQWRAASSTASSTSYIPYSPSHWPSLLSMSSRTFSPDFLHSLFCIPLVSNFEDTVCFLSCPMSAVSLTAYPFLGSPQITQCQRWSSVEPPPSSSALARDLLFYVLLLFTVCWFCHIVSITPRHEHDLFLTRLLGVKVASSVPGNQP